MRHFTAAVLACVVACSSGYAVAQRNPVYTDGFRRDLMSHCARLVWQFDRTADQRRFIGSIETARQDRQRGEAECRRGNYFEGIAALETALHAINVRPVPAPKPGDRETGAATFRR